MELLLPLVRNNELICQYSGFLYANFALVYVPSKPNPSVLDYVVTLRIARILEKLQLPRAKT